jgi:hypothetical protein
MNRSLTKVLGIYSFKIRRVILRAQEQLGVYVLFTKKTLVKKFRLTKEISLFDHRVHAPATHRNYAVIFLPFLIA